MLGKILENERAAAALQVTSERTQRGQETGEQTEVRPGAGVPGRVTVTKSQTPRDRKVVCEDNTPQWDPAEAQRLMEQCLTKTQNDVDAVLGFYDGITAGAIDRDPVVSASEGARR